MKFRLSSIGGIGRTLAGFLTAAGVVACAATLFGFLGRFYWFLDLFSHFRMQYLIGLSALALLLLAAKHWETAVWFVIFACINLACVLPLYLGGRKASAEDGEMLRAMLLNVNTRLGDPVRVKQAITDEDPDILVLEEVSSRWVAELSWITNTYPYAHTQPREDNFGIALFSRMPIMESETLYVGSALVPTIYALIDTGDTTLCVVATHPLPPWGSEYSRLRNEQLEQLPKLLRSPYPLLLLGDLNTTPWNYHFRRLVASSGLRDSARGYGFQPTWPNSNILMRIPLDHCLHSPDIGIIDRRIGAAATSDHFPLIVDFNVAKQEGSK